MRYWAPLALCLVLMLTVLPARAESQSELARVMSAAFREYAADKDKYSALFQKYLGIRRSPPECSTHEKWIPLSKVTPGSTLDQVLKRKTIKFGFYRHDPYYFTGSDGHDIGFEYELGTEIVKLINRQYHANLKLEWIERKFSLPGSGQDNIDIYNKLLPGLQDGEYDVAFSGLIILPDRPVSPTCPTMSFFWNAVYTGKDNWNVQPIKETNTDTLVKYLAQRPSVIILSTAGGPSEELAKDLGEKITKSGGKPILKTASVSGLQEAFKTKSVHLVVGDALALSSLSNQPKFEGVNLNITLKSGYSVAPITRLDPKNDSSKH
jgi:hypothetical protein